jgi:integrase
MNGLTDVALRRAKVGDTHRDGGLEFRFHADGVAGVRYVGRIRGTNKRISLALGSYPTLTLREARARAMAAKDQCTQGIDPRHTRQLAAAAQQNLIGDALTAYLDSRHDDRPTTLKDKKNTLGPALAGLAKHPIGQIGKADISKLLDSYANRAASKRKLFSYVSHFLGWAVERDLLPHNPCRDIRAPKPVAARDRVLTEAEIHALWHKVNSTWAIMARLILLTGQRGQEVCTMRRTDIDLETGVWLIPASVMKQKRAHRVPLSQSARTLISEMIAQHTANWGPYIFGVGSEGQRPFNGRSKGMPRLLRDTGTHGWSGHDCRRTAVTLMQRLGIPREVRSRITGHAQPRDGASAYEHHSFEVEARDAAERLAAEIDRIAALQPYLTEAKN